MTGAKLVFPGPGMDGKSIYELIEGERVSFAAGVPTVWQMMLGHMSARTDLEPSANLPEVSQTKAAEMLNVSERTVRALPGVWP